MKHGDLLRSVLSSITPGAAVAQGLSVIDELPAGPAVRALISAGRVMHVAAVRA